MLIKLAFAAIGLTASISINAQPWGGPFGLEMGVTGDEMKKAIPDLKKISETAYSFKKAPKHYPGTDLYIAHFGKTVGLCKVAAISTVESSNFGDSVRQKFVGIKDAISAKYGVSTSDYDFLMAGSIWKEPRDWMMGLAKGDRFLSSYWTKEKDKKGQLKMPTNIDTIALDAKGSSSNMASVHLTYEFSNFDTCLEEAKKSSSDAL